MDLVQMVTSEEGRTQQMDKCLSFAGMCIWLRGLWLSIKIHTW